MCYIQMRLLIVLKVKACAEMKQYNLSMGQSWVLAYLDSRGGQATQKEIEAFLEVEQNGYVS